MKSISSKQVFNELENRRKWRDGIERFKRTRAKYWTSISSINNSQRISPHNKNSSDYSSIMKLASIFNASFFTRECSLMLKRYLKSLMLNVSATIKQVETIQTGNKPVGRAR